MPSEKAFNEASRAEKVLEEAGFEVPRVSVSDGYARVKVEFGFDGGDEDER